MGRVVTAISFKRPPGAESGGILRGRRFVGMSTISSLSCPCCYSAVTEDVLRLKCGNLDGSLLYPELRLRVCVSCGHAFNSLLPEEIDGLRRYYNNEYAPVNLNSAVTEGDRPGSTDPLTNGRFANLFSFIKPHVTEDSALLDIGCALGGFLQYLSDRGFKHLSGVEPTSAYVERAETASFFTVKHGDAENLPFPEASFDIAIIEQVLEHLVQPSSAFREAFRVIKDNGFFCIGVPDASRYADYNFFDFYWVLLREHIQHFTIETLTRLAESEGFILVDYMQNDHAIMSAKMVMPNLYAIFRKAGSSAVAGTSERIAYTQGKDLKEYVQQEFLRLARKRAIFEKLSRDRTPVYVWGVGREFLYLYEEAGLKNCNIVGLIDMNEHRQQQTVGRIPIKGPEQLDNAGPDAKVIITAVAHVDAIKGMLSDIGFSGEVFIFE